MARKLTQRQRDVLAKACTHGHLSQGCHTRSDYGGLSCTLASLRRAGLLNVMDEPTDLGRSVHQAGGVLPSNTGNERPSGSAR